MHRQLFDEDYSKLLRSFKSNPVDKVQTLFTGKNVVFEYTSAERGKKRLVLTNASQIHDGPRGHWKTLLLLVNSQQAASYTFAKPMLGFINTTA